MWCRRVVFCSGKVFYDIHAEREKRGLDKESKVAIVRLEQVGCGPCTGSFFVKR